MSIISRATLRITKEVAKDTAFYGKLINVNTITDENIMDKFESTCPNTGISVEFKYRHKGLDLYQNKYEIKANKYAFDYIIGGLFRIFIYDSDYLYELSVRANENNDLQLDKGVFVCIYDLDDYGEYKIVDKIEIKDAKLVI